MLRRRPSSQIQRPTNRSHTAFSKAHPISCKVFVRPKLEVHVDTSLVHSDRVEQIVEELNGRRTRLPGLPADATTMKRCASARPAAGQKPSPKSSVVTFQLGAKTMSSQKFCGTNVTKANAWAMPVGSSRALAASAARSSASPAEAALARHHCPSRWRRLVHHRRHRLVYVLANRRPRRESAQRTRQRCVKQQNGCAACHGRCRVRLWQSVISQDTRACTAEALSSVSKRTRGHSKPALESLIRLRARSDEDTNQPPKAPKVQHYSCSMTL